MSVNIVCVKPMVGIYRKFKFFSQRVSLPHYCLFYVPCSLALLYNTDATGHDMTDIGWSNFEL